VIGSSPLVAVGVAPVKPDVVVTNGSPRPSPATIPPSPTPQPDVEVAVATLEEDATVLVEREGRLVAAVELISPRNKDRPSSREQYAARYLNYLRGGVHLLLVDVHRSPLEFSFAQLIAEGLLEVLPAPVSPSAVSFSVWHHALVIGEPLPPMPLPLSLDDLVMVDLEATYSRAATDSYIA
jgi:hypothetical protein